MLLNSYIKNGIDTLVWKDPTFVEVIPSVKTWEEANEPSLAKVFTAAVTHPGKWLEWATKSAEFGQQGDLLKDVANRIATRDVPDSKPG